MHKCNCPAHNSRGIYISFMFLSVNRPIFIFYFLKFLPSKKGTLIFAQFSRYSLKLTWPEEFYNIPTGLEYP